MPHTRLYSTNQVTFTAVGRTTKMQGISVRDVFASDNTNCFLPQMLLITTCVLSWPIYKSFALIYCCKTYKPSRLVFFKELFHLSNRNIRMQKRIVEALVQEKAFTIYDRRLCGKKNHPRYE